MPSVSSTSAAGLNLPTNMDNLMSGASGPSAGDRIRNGEISSDTFLKLLADQLRYQNPMSPMEGTDFLAQTATVSQVEQLTKISTALSAASKSSNLSTAASLVGRTVSWLDPDGIASAGRVDSAAIVSGQVTLRIVDGSTVPIDAVIGIIDPAALGTP
jgi:flagellar basal-body rod modification protein FlgD